MEANSIQMATTSVLTNAGNGDVPAHSGSSASSTITCVRKTPLESSEICALQAHPAADVISIAGLMSPRQPNDLQSNDSSLKINGREHAAGVENVSRSVNRAHQIELEIANQEAVLDCLRKEHEGKPGRWK